MGRIYTELTQQFISIANKMAEKSSTVVKVEIFDFVIVKYSAKDIRIYKCLTCFHHFPISGDAVKLPLKGWLLRKKQNGYAVEFVGVTRKTLFGIKYVSTPLWYKKLECADLNTRMSD